MDKKLDFSPELGRLLKFTAEVGSAIRMYTAYNQADSENTKQYAEEDVLWLSDCLHHFGVLGDALIEGGESSIAAACKVLSETFRSYAIDRPGCRPSVASFERNRDRFTIGEALEIFGLIRIKAESELAVA